MNFPWPLLLTLACYVPAQWVYNRYQQPWLHPVITALIAIVGLLALLDLSYEHYLAGNQLLITLLGPVTVALAVPMLKQTAIMKQHYRVLLLSLGCASTLIVVTAVLLGLALGADQAMLATLSTKSITGAIALMVSDALGGYGGLAAIIVLVTGIYGVIIAQPLFKLLGITDDAAKGFALGIAAHAVGTAYAFEQSQQCGSFAALGMSVNGLLTALILPFALALIN